MFATTPVVFTWLGAGLRGALAMVWMTWWPLVFGFALSGVVQGFLRPGELAGSLGTRGVRGVLRASTLGVVSSSCSYAASAMARALFSRGATWTNAMIFMVASTNLVIELGVVLWVLLGWQFFLAECVGGAIMIALLSLVLPRVFSSDAETSLRTRVLDDAPSAPSDVAPLRERLRTLDEWTHAARFTLGDVTMLRVELALGFLVAGFLAVHVPAHWWHAVFLTGHGPWTLIENVIIAVPLAVVSCVCSVGNIPLAAALWSGGIAFGGVIAFIFADLVALPLLLIYRRFYGTSVALRLFGTFWVVMSAGGLLCDLLFRAAHAIPTHRTLPATSGDFAMGATLVLNVIALVVAVVVVMLARRDVHGTTTATDPVCGMQVVTAGAAATVTHEGVVYYFCAPRCAERFAATPDRYRDSSSTPSSERPPSDTYIDPICQMSVDPTSATAFVDHEGQRVYFCCDGCRDTFIERTTNAL